MFAFYVFYTFIHKEKWTCKILIIIKIYLNKNFEYIFNLLTKNSDGNVYKPELEPIVKALIVCFDVNYITNSTSFNDKVCIKIGKFLLPNSYYIKKED